MDMTEVSSFLCQMERWNVNTIVPPNLYADNNGWQTFPPLTSPNHVLEDGWGFSSVLAEETPGHGSDMEPRYPVGLTTLEMGLFTAATPTLPMQIVQINGQRVYGPPSSYLGPPPPRGAEVFVGALPADCFEQELIPLFETMGRIYQLRLMMHFSGSSRGYGFVKFYTAHEASRAIEQLHDYEIRPGKRIGVLRSVDNCHLLLDGFSISLSRDEILTEITKVTEGLVGITFQPSQKSLSDRKGRIRFFNQAVIEFESHRAASMARRHFFQQPLKLHGYSVMVSWWNPPLRVRRR